MQSIEQFLFAFILAVKGPKITVTKSTTVTVLVLAGIKLISMVQGFGFVTKTVLVTHGCFIYF